MISTLGKWSFQIKLCRNFNRDKKKKKKTFPWCFVNHNVILNLILFEILGMSYGGPLENLLYIYRYRVMIISDMDNSC
jgi:hypothetical protein